MLLLGLIYALIMMGWSSEYGYLEKIILLFRSVVQFLAVGVFVERNFDENPLVIFSKYYAYVVVFYVLSSCVFLIDLSLRSVWIAVINENTNATKALELVEQAGLYVTRFGLMGYSGFSCTMICSFGVLLWTIFCKNINILQWITVLLLLLLGNMFYGRSGLIISVFMIVVHCICHGEWKKCLKLCVYLIPILMIMIVTLTTFVESEYITYWMEWMLNPINDFIESFQNGKFSIGSSGNVMLNMYYIPNDDSTIIFGDGEYRNSDGSYYGHTDVGLMRMMLFGGIFNILFFYGSFILLLVGGYDLNGYVEKRTIFFISLITCAFFEFKGDALHFYYGLFFTLIYIINFSEKTWFSDDKSYNANLKTRTVV